MFYLHASNKTENLLKHLAAVIEAEPLTSFFSKEYFVIQSQGMERMISQAMAAHFKSWCNYAFYLPVSFLQDIANKLGMPITPDLFERNFLTWRIEEKLRNIEDNVYTPLRRYLEGESQELKRYQLAHQLAHIFDQYQLMRPEMLQSWKQGKCYTPEKAELWQMHLWNRLLADPQVCRHRGDLLQLVIEKLNTPASAQDYATLLPKRVSIFGLNILPPIFLDYLNGLSRHCDVHLYLLSPCKKYWGDMFRRKAKETLSAEAHPNHPLLQVLGKQGRDFQELLLEKVDFHQEITSYDDLGRGEGSTLLYRLQSDLLNGQIHRQGQIETGDKSVRVVSCHSILRELEVLKDHILEILSNNKQIQLSDMVVMTPDIQEYAPFIPAVFEEIQHSIADRSQFRKNRYIAIFRQFLALFKSRFGWSEVLDIFEKECVYPNFAVSQRDIERIKDWVVSSGIRWGLSLEFREKTGFDFATNSWQVGLQRLLMGYAIDTEDTVAGIHPYPEVEGGDANILGGLCEYVDIIQCGAEEFSHTYGLREWSELLIKYIDRLFGNQDNREILELIEIVNELKLYAEQHRSKVEIGVISKWLEDMTAESRSASGFLKGQLTFCSMLPMRSIPFKTVCLLGLNYGVFPKNDKFKTFDLMKSHPQKGDRSNRTDDRYQFLEAILSARQSLYLSYVGQSLENNETIPPSVVLSELLDVIRREYTMDDLLEVHPLHGFSEKYFRSDSTLYSYNEGNMEVAQSLKKSRKESEKWWSGKIDSEVDIVSFAELLKFYSNPQRYFVDVSLGLPLSGTKEMVEESETFTATGLQNYFADQYILDAMLKEKSMKEVDDKLRADGLWSLGNPGELFFHQKTGELVEFVSRLHELELGKPLNDIEFDISLGPYTLQGRLSNLFENGVLYMRYARFKGKDLLMWWLNHLLAKELGLACYNTHLLMKDSTVSTTSQNITGPTLENMLKVYAHGITEPSPLFLQPGIDYCRQSFSTRATVPPLQKARSTYREMLENGYEPSWSLLFGNTSDDEVLNDSFVGLTEQLLMPLWSAYNG